MIPDYEAWREALIAFWKVDCCFQRAANLTNGGKMDGMDRRTIEAMIVAGEHAPKRKLAA